MVAAADIVRPSAARAIAELKQLGIEPVMMTGDNRRTAEAVASQVGIERVFAEVLPQDKADGVKQLQAEGKFVAMVGDGVNDAPALAQADLGIAIGAGTDVAVETGDIVLMKSDPLDVLGAIQLSKATVRKMKQNLFWAAIYNVIAIPVAAGALYPGLRADAAAGVRGAGDVGFEHHGRFQRFAAAARRAGAAAQSSTMTTRDRAGGLLHQLPRVAAVLLISLIAHLLLMTTPLHAAMLAPGMAESHPERPGETLVANQELAWSPLGAVHGQHCAMEWRTSAQPPLTFLGRVGVLNLSALVLSEPLRWRPRAQALGPPPQVDRQALLQVFRM